MIRTHKRFFKIWSREKEVFWVEEEEGGEDVRLEEFLFYFNLLFGNNLKIPNSNQTGLIRTISLVFFLLFVFNLIEYGFEKFEQNTKHRVQTAKRISRDTLLQSLPMNMIFNYEKATCLLQVLKIIVVRYILYPTLDTSVTLKARCGGLTANLHDKLGNIA